MMTQMLLDHQAEPGWKLERQGSALLLRRDSTHHSPNARVCFRCDVEVREFEPDEEEYHYYNEPSEVDDYLLRQEEMEQMDLMPSGSLAMCASCLAALCVTVVLPWLLIGG